MKRLLVIFAVIFAASFVFVSCNKEEKADLAWKNGASANINTIVWANGDATWANGTTGYAPSEDTEYKEVTELVGQVTCSIDAGGALGFQLATVTILETGGTDSTLSLNDGDKKIYTIEAQIVK